MSAAQTVRVPCDICWRVVVVEDVHGSVLCPACIEEMAEW